MTNIPPVTPKTDQSANATSFVKRIANLVATNYGTSLGMVQVALGELEYVAGTINRFVAPDARRVKRLVFVCLGNFNRSPFASALACAHGACATSVGLWTSPGVPASGKAIETAAFFGIDLTAHRTKGIADYRFEEGDLLLAMEIRHALQLAQMGIPSAQIALLGHWATPHRIHIHDPHLLTGAYFRSCFSILNVAVLNLIDHLKLDASPSINR